MSSKQHGLSSLQERNRFTIDGIAKCERLIGQRKRIVAIEIVLHDKLYKDMTFVVDSLGQQNRELSVSCHLLDRILVDFAGQNYPR